MVKISACQCRRSGFNPWAETFPWRREWQPTPVLLPGESPWTEEPGGLQTIGSQESDTNERLIRIEVVTGNAHCCFHTERARVCF